MKKFLFVILTAGLFASALPASAAPVENLEDLFFLEIPNVVTASKKEESVDNAPNVMYVVTREQIKNRGYKNLEDVLNDVPGFSVWYENQSHAVQVRGIATADNEGLLVLVNGHNIRGPFEPDPLGGEVMLNMVERIEIVVGPGSVLYGSDSLYGIVNVITEKFEGKGVGIKVGNDGYSEGYVSFGAKKDESNYGNFNVSYLERGGFDPKYNDNLKGSKILGDALPSFNIVAKGAWKGLDVQYFHHSYTFSDTQTYYTLNHADGETREYLDAFDTKYKSDLTDRLQGLATFSYDNKRHIRRPTDMKGQPLVIGAFTFDLQEIVYSGEYTLQYKTDQHFLQAGLQGSRHSHDNNYWGIIAPTTPDFDVNGRSPYDPANSGKAVNSYWWPGITPGETYTLGVYLSEEFRPIEKLTLTAALRADKNTLLVGDYNRFYLNPRLAAGYKVTDDYQVKAMYNRATRFPGPQMSQRNIVWGKGKPWVEQATNFANLNDNVKQPAILDAYELQNILYAFKSRIAVNVFYQELKNLITWAGPHSNIGNYKGHGVEFSVMSKITNKLTSTLGGQYSSNTLDYTVDISPTFRASQVLSNLDTGDLVGVPKFIGNLLLDYNVTKNLSLSPSLRYFTGQTMNDKPNSSAPDHWTTADNRFYVNWAMRYKNICNIFDVGLSVQNLLDNDQSVSAQANYAAYRIRPLSIILDVSAKF